MAVRPTLARDTVPAFGAFATAPSQGFHKQIRIGKLGGAIQCLPNRGLAMRAFHAGLFTPNGEFALVAEG